MATIQEVSPAPWRMRLVPASFAGVRFHVEQQARSSGRRIVLHEYPKRDNPYAEDMGRAARRFQVTGYLIGPNYLDTKRQLIQALESENGGTYTDPYFDPVKCACERYGVTEVRERGGYCTFEMAFVESGAPGNSIQVTNTAADATSKSTNMMASMTVRLNGIINNLVTTVK